MLKQIEKLEKKYGDFNKVAEVLGITPRHLRRVKKENNASETLKILINKLALDPEREAA